MASEENPFDFEVDPALEELSNGSPPLADERVAIIRTSDRINFRRCRRRWAWASHLRGNLTSVESASPLWFGSGIHYALEDYHGLRKHTSATAAFKAYVKATHLLAKSRNDPRLLPYDWIDLCKLGIGMLDYYTDVWLSNRPALQTYIHNGQPQVEVHALVEVPVQSPHYDRILYAATLDRVVIDEWGELWIIDYKTAKRIQTTFFQTDPQISAYCWIGHQLYDKPIAGFIYQQHRKDLAEEPRILSSGKVSTAKTMLTTHSLYRRTLINLYGSIENTPPENIDYLNFLVDQETPDHDRYIRRDRIFRNEHQHQAEGTKLMMELEEMLNPDLPLYPSPTRDCGNLCNFQSACVSLDDGGDWEYELHLSTRQKDAVFDSWRQYLPKEFA